MARKLPKLRRVTEHDIQHRFFQMVDSTGHSSAKLTYAVPNAALGQKGSRIHFFMAEGVRPGVADVIVLFPNRGHYCLAIEFKRPGESPRPKQREFLANVTAAGGLAVVMTDAEVAFRLWCWYVGLVEEV